MVDAGTLRLNPFQPDQPARFSIFTGRGAERELIQGTLADTLRGRASHVLITGERGMGKTSLARYVAELAASPKVHSVAGADKPPAVIFSSLGYSPTVDEVCASILSEAYRWARERNPALLQWFSNELAKLDGLTVSFLGVTLKAGARSPSAVPRAFPEAIERFARSAKDSGGLVIILDETEAISSDPAFPSFFKSVIETLGARGLTTIEFVVTVTPDGRDRMTAAHESFPRLFRHVAVGPLTDAEVAELVQLALAEGRPRKKADEQFLSSIQHYASGIPSFVHEIGRAAFDVDTDDVLSFDDFRAGVLGTDRVVGALAMLEQKHFRERYSKKILSNTYREILHAVAGAAGDDVSVEEVRKGCPNISQVAPYLSNMAKRGVLVRVEGRKGVYRLPDRMFGVFLRLAASRFKRVAPAGKTNST